MSRPNPFERSFSQHTQNQPLSPLQRTSSPPSVSSPTRMRPTSRFQVPTLSVRAPSRSSSRDPFRPGYEHPIHEADENESEDNPLSSIPLYPLEPSVSAPPAVESASAPLDDHQASQPNDQETSRPTRRVQWASAIARGLSSRESSNSRPRRGGAAMSDDRNVTTPNSLAALDERGTDPMAFAVLSSALEQHRKNPASPVPSPQTVRIDPSAAASAFTSGAQTPYTMDSTTAGNSPLDEFMRATVPDIDAYIPPGETEGLPAPIDEGTNHSKEAGNLVAAHKSGLGRFWRWSRKKDIRKPKGDEEKRANAEDVDLEHRGQSSSIGMGLSRLMGTHDHSSPTRRDFHTPQLQGHGVLSSLLALYSQNEDQANSRSTIASSRAPMIQSLPTHRHTSRRGGFHWHPDDDDDDDSDDDDDGNGRHTRRRSPPTPPGARSPPMSRPGSYSEFPLTNARAQAASPPENAPLSSHHRQGSSYEALGRHFVKPAVNLVKTGRTSTRPAAARSGGGVIGTLIASTGNITAVATPTASSIAPTVKRRGYHLSRYSLDESALEKKRKEEEKAKKMVAALDVANRGHGRSVSYGGPLTFSDGARPASTFSAESAPLPHAMSAPTTPFATDDQNPLEVALGSRGGPHGSTTSLRSVLKVTGSGHKRGASSGGETAQTGDSITPVGSRFGGGESLKKVGSAGSGLGSRIIGEPIKKVGSVGSGLANGIKRSNWSSKLHLPMPTPSIFGGDSRLNTPAAESDAGSLVPEWMTEKEAAAKERRNRKKKEKRRRQEIFITMHVAEVLQRQEFILKLTRSLMMFGAPSHRLEAQIQATGRVLDIPVSCMYLPNVMLLSFGDTATHTSETKLLKQGADLDLGKLTAAHSLYWQVTHDKIGVTEASAALDVLMRKKKIYRGWLTVIIGGACAAFICPISFQGSFVDACMAFVLGALLVFIQNISSRNELYSNVFEITIATLISFLSAALASTHKFCYSAVVSGSVVLILPGYIVLCGSLELASRNVISGAVRMGYSVIYSLFLGFGLAIGAEIYRQVSGRGVENAGDYMCGYTHNSNGPWYQQTASGYWAYLCVPMFSLFLSLRNQAPIRKELIVAVLVSCAGWTCNHFASKKFTNRSDITSAIGSFAVGLLGNLYGRFSSGNAFVVMITGILFQLPSGLANGGLLAFANESTQGSETSYSEGFSVAEQLVSVAIGLTVGLFVSAAVVHPFGSKRRGAGLFSL